MTKDKKIRAMKSQKRPNHTKKNENCRLIFIKPFKWIVVYNFQVKICSRLMVTFIFGPGHFGLDFGILFLLPANALLFGTLRNKFVIVCEIILKYWYLSWMYHLCTLWYHGGTVRCDFVEYVQLFKVQTTKINNFE